MNDSKDRVAPTTYNNYRYIMDRHIEPYFAMLPKQDLESLTVRDINNYYNSLRKKGLSESSVVKQHHIFAAAFNQAIRDGMISTNIIEGVKAPVEDYYEVNFSVAEFDMRFSSLFIKIINVKSEIAGMTG